jgi:hypothetical protein
LDAADARLRSAYASAEGAGVQQSTLAAYDNEWSRLRRRSAYEPALVTARYHQMADSLSRLAARERGEPVEQAEPGPFHRVRTQMAALWR